MNTIRNKNYQEKLKEDEMQIYFDLFDGPLQIQNTFNLLLIFLDDFYSLLSVRCYCTYLY